MIASSAAPRRTKTLQDLRLEADAAFRRGDPVDALRRYRAILAGAPSELDARLRIADCLAALAERDLATDVYRAATAAYARAGYPLRALVAARAIEDLTGETSDLVDAVTTIFAEGSSKVARIGARLAPPALHEHAAPVTAVLLADEVRELASAAWSEARVVGDLGPAPEKFAPAPVLSDLPSEIASSLVRASRLRRIAPGGIVVSPTKQRSTIVLVARGQVQLDMMTARGPCALGTLGEGALLGHEPFVGGGPVRITATAIDDVDVLEIPTSALQQSVAASPEAGAVLGRTLRAELLQSVLRTSPLFRGFPARKRLDLLKRMQSCRVEAGQYILRQGTASQGMYLVLSGEVRIVVTAEGVDHAVYALGAGDLVGLTSTAYDGISTASVVAVRETTLMFLPADAVRRLVTAYPALGSELSVEAMARADMVRKVVSRSGPSSGIRRRW
jgi:CRP-like cAMP-binding protein